MCAWYDNIRKPPRIAETDTMVCLLHSYRGGSAGRYCCGITTGGMVVLAQPAFPFLPFGPFPPFALPFLFFLGILGGLEAMRSVWTPPSLNAVNRGQIRQQCS